MSLFVDASALVAIIVNEPEREQFRDSILAEPDPLWSAMSCWETVSAVARAERLSADLARTVVQRSADALGLRIVAIGAFELTTALGAHQKFGRGSGHPAKLNFGDCFAYACAKANGAKLLYKGDDFIHTDLA
ncbi:type II toxin-antitoxin system VapC family toxin [Sphingomonas sp. 28-62-11]|uniref:type II toxin-antitoxin system VapC family toxin n=1 Tax=Sphingomonas sp. 28-62-11 TaxID=1970432 RepID=UPI000BC394BC|nr:MAG: VapC toxin family PIN domain ribonuclease [Sphingomonas sp. 28-62-11]